MRLFWKSDNIDPGGVPAGAPTADCTGINNTSGPHQFAEPASLFQQVFKYAPFGMSVAGLDGQIIQANASLCRMLEYPSTSCVTSRGRN